MRQSRWAEVFAKLREVCVIHPAEKSTANQVARRGSATAREATACHNGLRSFDNVRQLGKSRFLLSRYRQIEGTLLTVERILLIELRKLATRLARMSLRLFHLDLTALPAPDHAREGTTPAKASTSASVARRPVSRC
jgi:hypothetical protein